MARSANAIAIATPARPNTALSNTPARAVSKMNGARAMAVVPTTRATTTAVIATTSPAASSARPAVTPLLKSASAPANGCEGVKLGNRPTAALVFRPWLWAEPPLAPFATPPFGAGADEAGVEWVAGVEWDAAGRVELDEPGVGWGTVAGCGVNVGKVMCGNETEGTEPRGRDGTGSLMAGSVTVGRLTAGDVARGKLIPGTFTGGRDIEGPWEPDCDPPGNLMLGTDTWGTLALQPLGSQPPTANNRANRATPCERCDRRSPDDDPSRIPSPGYTSRTAARGTAHAWSLVGWTDLGAFGRDEDRALGVS